MPKIKTKKTLLKRIRVTKNKKFIHGQISTGHLKVKWDASRRSRKDNNVSVVSNRYKRKLRKLLGKNA